MGSMEEHNLQHLCAKCSYGSSTKAKVPFSIILKQLNIKITIVHHPVIKKEGNEILALSVFEPSTGGAGFYTYICVVPKCMSGL